MTSWLAMNARNQGLVQDHLLCLALSQQQHSERRPLVVSSIRSPSTTTPRSVRDLLIDALGESQNLQAAASSFSDSYYRVGETKGGASSYFETPGDLPTKLYAILSNTAYEHIVCWMPHGYAWKIKDLNLFVSEILPVFVDRGTYPSNFDAFVSLLKAYGFKQLTRGVDTSAYYHELFLRGIPHLHGLMRPVPGLDRLPLHTPDCEPNFTTLRPLPKPARRVSSIPPEQRHSTRTSISAATTAPAPGALLNQILHCRTDSRSLLPQHPAAAPKHHFPLTVAPPRDRRPSSTLVSGSSNNNTPVQEDMAAQLHLTKLRDAQRLHREHLQYLDEARRLADLQISTPPSSPKAKEVMIVKTTSPGKDTNKKSILKKKSTRRKWLPPLGPPTPVTPIGSSSSSNDWFLTNAEAFAALSDAVRLPSK